jgi:hypothetical protein
MRTEKGLLAYEILEKRGFSVDKVPISELDPVFQFDDVVIFEITRQK